MSFDKVFNGPPIGGASGPALAIDLSSGRLYYASQASAGWLPTADSSPTGLTLQTDGVENPEQTLLNLEAGTGVNLTDDGAGTVTIDSTVVAPTLQHGGVANGSQVLLNLAGGTGITVSDNGTGQITLATTVVAPTLQANGVAAGSQTLLNLAASKGVTVTDNGTGTMTVSLNTVQFAQTSDQASLYGLFSAGASAPLTNAKAVMYWTNVGAGTQDVAIQGGTAGSIFLSCGTVYSYMTSAGIMMTALAAAPADAALIRSGSWISWLNEAGNLLTFKCKYSNATIKSGAIALV